MGDECPGGRARRHKRFFAGPNCVGTLLAVETPEPFGPRNLDQSGAAAAERLATKRTAEGRSRNTRARTEVGHIAAV
jgi:hypothetical protein